MPLTFGTQRKNLTLAATEEATLRLVVDDITFDNSYPTGGETLLPADLGLVRIEHLEARQNGVGTRLAEYDYANSKLKLYTAIGTEAGNASDQSSIVVRVMAIGRGVRL